MGLNSGTPSYALDIVLVLRWQLLQIRRPYHLQINGFRHDETPFLVTLPSRVIT